MLNGMDDYAMDDYPSDDYIEDIPFVRSFGTKRARSQPNTAPTTIRQAIVPWTGDLQQPFLVVEPSLVVDLSATEKPGSSIVLRKAKMEVIEEPGSPIVLKKAKMEVIESVPVTAEEIQLRLFEDLQRVVADQKLEFVNVADGFREDIAQKERLITTLQTEIGALKDELLMKQSHASEEQVRRHNKEIADVRDQAMREKEELTMRSQREVQNLKDSVREETQRYEREKEALKASLLDAKERHSRHVRNTDDSKALLEEKEKHDREIKDLKILLDERNGVIARYKRQTEELKASFLLEKALIEDRHTQEMASYTSEIIAVVLQRNTKHHETQSSVVQHSSV